MWDFIREVGSGTWPDWIGAIGTSLAFMVAAGSYFQSVRMRKESQARLIYSRVIDTQHYEPGDLFETLPGEARIGNGAQGVSFVFPSEPDEPAHYLATVPIMQLTAVIHNGSKELIGPVKIQVVNTGAKSTYDSSLSFGPIEPESDYRVSFVLPNDVHPGQPSLGTTLLFRDASGQWWRRHLYEPIQAVHDDPENTAPTRSERAAYARNALLMGMEPTSEPAPSRRVRWHRFRRKLLGKSPLP